MAFIPINPAMNMNPEELMGKEKLGMVREGGWEA
jgi:hypothetical protein